jgi:pilus assembly protein Flp/PilA
MLKLIAKAHARFMRDDKGATAIEYGLIAAGIAVGISVVVFAFGDQLVALFEDMGAELENRPS